MVLDTQDGTVCNSLDCQPDIACVCIDRCMTENIHTLVVSQLHVMERLVDVSLSHIVYVLLAMSNGGGKG